MSYQWSKSQTPVGVGLRHVHYHDALFHTANLDFVEVHAENFFARGGASTDVLQEVINHYPLSIHGTSMGLGSFANIPEAFLKKFAHLVEWSNPVLVSEHAAFTWVEDNNQIHHAGDLLPLAFDDNSLNVLSDNVSRIQDLIQKQILIENISAYLSPGLNALDETEFLSALVDQTGCRLLVDINNLAVNAFNAGISISQEETLEHTVGWLERIPVCAVGEIHLAGCTPAADGEIMVDDHSHQVTPVVWQAYMAALKRFGPVPTLIEWDTNLPDWQTLLDEANKARLIANEVFSPSSKEKGAITQ